MHRFDEQTPALITVSASFACVIQLRWLMWCHCGYSKVCYNAAAAGRGTRPYCGWSLGVMSIDLM